MKIKEVAEKFTLTTHTLRYYEKIGVLGPVQKDSSGIRDYSSSDLDRIQFIKCMKGTGMSMESIHHYIKLYNMGNQTKKERLSILLDQKKTLLETMKDLQVNLDYLDKKIKNYKK